MRVAVTDEGGTRVGVGRIARVVAAAHALRGSTPSQTVQPVDAAAANGRRASRPRSMSSASLTPAPRSSRPKPPHTPATVCRSATSLRARTTAWSCRSTDAARSPCTSRSPAPTPRSFRRTATRPSAPATRSTTRPRTSVFFPVTSDQPVPGLHRDGLPRISSAERTRRPGAARAPVESPSDSVPASQEVTRRFPPSSVALVMPKAQSAHRAHRGHERFYGDERVAARAEVTPSVASVLPPRRRRTTTSCCSGRRGDPSAVSGANAKAGAAALAPRSSLLGSLRRRGSLLAATCARTTTCGRRLRDAGRRGSRCSIVRVRRARPHRAACTSRVSPRRVDRRAWTAI